jgi:hypothetical protein
MDLKEETQKSYKNMEKTIQNIKNLKEIINHFCILCEKKECNHYNNNIKDSLIYCEKYNKNLKMLKNKLNFERGTLLGLQTKLKESIKDFYNSFRNFLNEHIGEENDK